MIGDGFGPAQLTLARLASPHKKLLLDELLVAKVSTASSDSLVTDSAAGATAYSCGLKTFNRGVAVRPDRKACATLLEAAKAGNMRTGIVVTSELTHATPAAFASHSVSRDDEAFIGRQMLDQFVDVSFGGGLGVFSRNNMLDWANSHYKVIKTKEELEAGGLTRPLLGLFAEGQMDFTIDGSTEQPTLAQMTEVAIPLLTNNKGFFLMVEGSRIDHAAHQNDVAAMVKDILAFDEALKVVIEFAEESENTLVVVLADHETGGMTIGRNGLYSYNITALNAIHHSIEHIANSITEPVTADKTVAAVRGATEGLFAPNDEAFFPATITSRAAAVTAITEYFNSKTQTGWTTKGHTGVDVNMFGFGMGVTKFVGGVRSNEAVGSTLAKIMKFDLDKLTAKLANFGTDSGNTKRDFNEQKRSDSFHEGI
jgi:alkaline phosphatase